MSRPSRPGRRTRRRSWRTVDFVALDFELTGLDPDRDDIVSFGAVRISDGRVSLADALYREVRPEVPSSREAVKIHGLRSVDLDHASPLRDVVHELSAALANRYLLAWVADVEIGFLRKTFGGRHRSWTTRTIDVFELEAAYRAAAGSDPRPAGLGLAHAAERHGVPVGDAHHALDDALMTAELFLVLATRLEAAGRGRVVDLQRARSPS